MIEQAETSHFVFAETLLERVIEVLRECPAYSRLQAFTIGETRK